jgi:hypothetical protein
MNPIMKTTLKVIGGFILFCSAMSLWADPTKGGGDAVVKDGKFELKDLQKQESRLVEDDELVPNKEALAIPVRQIKVSESDFYFEDLQGKSIVKLELLGHAELVAPALAQHPISLPVSATFLTAPINVEGQKSSPSLLLSGWNVFYVEDRILYGIQRISSKAKPEPIRLGVVRADQSVALDSEVKVELKLRTYSPAPRHIKFYNARDLSRLEYGFNINLGK